MIKICFVCLGNICRSPMAEFIMKEKVRQLQLENNFQIESKATSYEEEENDLYPPVKEILKKNHIPYTKHKAKRLEADDNLKFDKIICMDESNIKAVSSIIKDSRKISKLLERDISDPWYTRDFQKAYDDISEGIDQLIKELKEER